MPREKITCEPIERRGAHADPGCAVTRLYRASAVDVRGRRLPRLHEQAFVRREETTAVIRAERVPSSPLSKKSTSRRSESTIIWYCAISGECFRTESQTSVEEIGETAVEQAPKN